jgi:salicylate hydroxylase
VKLEVNTNFNWTICSACLGRGKTSQRLKKKVRLSYQNELDKFFSAPDKSNAAMPIKPKSNLLPCQNCLGSGIMQTATEHLVDPHFPTIAIIGAGIGGVAFAVACLHRRIPFTLYERDTCFEARSQGYGLTLQQANKAIASLGILALKEGVVSTKHIVHTTDGEVIGEWGMRKWLAENHVKDRSKKHTNIHIARQALRLELLDQLGSTDVIQWGKKLVSIQENEENLQLGFECGGEFIQAAADLVVGADGIRSMVRQLTMNENKNPLRYLGCMVILGICPLSEVHKFSSILLDSETVFQTANGTERIYIMPYAKDAVMWQLSFPIAENEAKSLSLRGAPDLKLEASKRTQWHSPIPEIVSATNETKITGYPVYDREFLTIDALAGLGKATLIGDAAHPMSPFKGQGANQAILDALLLAREIAKNCQPLSNWREKGIRKSVLAQFESEMLARAAVKVKDSADAVHYLHSAVVLKQGDEPRGRSEKQKI